MESSLNGEEDLKSNLTNPYITNNIKNLEDFIRESNHNLKDLDDKISNLLNQEERNQEDEDRLDSIKARRKYTFRAIKKAVEERDRLLALASASQKVEALTDSLQEELNKLPERNVGDANVIKLQSQISQLTDQSRKLLEIQAQPSVNNFAPDLTVLTPKVKLVDANLAYKFSDAQSDTNILLGFTTLVLGVALSTAISLVLALLTSTDKTTTAVYGTITGFTLVFSIGLSWLTVRAYRKAERAKRQLENDADEKKIVLSIGLDRSIDSNDTIEK